MLQQNINKTTTNSWQSYLLTMSGLEEVGIPGPDNLKEALTNCSDPLSAIEEFQVKTVNFILSLM